MENFNKPGRKAPRAYISAAVIVAFLATNAEAALLTNVDGKVSVNHGSGFRPSGGGDALAPGDRVSAGEGSADIVYDNGCSARVGPHQVVVVLSSPPSCNGGGLKDTAMAAPFGYGVDPLIVGGVVAAGAVGLAVALSNGNSSPASP
jgi:hypothetical protein